MQKKQIFKNAIITVTSMVVNAVTLFFLYQFLLRSLGAEQLGIWSLVLASTSISQVLNLGLSGGIVIFVAKYVARSDIDNINNVIQTALTSIVLIITPVCFIAFFIAKYVLSLVMSDTSLFAAVMILPYAFLAFWLMMISSIFHSGLDGYQRIDIRNYIVMGGTILYLLLCYLLVPGHGLLGVAYARVIQYLVVLVISWLLMKRLLPALPIFPYKLDKNLFKEMFKYGVNFQILTYTFMLLDPVTKALLSKFGGLSMVGYYEMANKMVLQFKSIIGSTTRVLVPAVADLKERLPEKINIAYSNSYKLTFYIALPIFCIIAISGPIISDIWIGHYVEYFVLFTFLLAIGGFLHTLSVPAYVMNLGTGDLRWNVIGHLVMAMLNLGGGLLLGWQLGGYGVVVAWVFAMSTGSAVIYLAYHIKNEIHLKELVLRSDKLIVLVCGIGLIFFIIINFNINRYVNSKFFNVLNSFIFSIVIIILSWVHPMRKLLMSWVNQVIRPAASE